VPQKPAAFVRFQATEPNRRGHFPGVFGLVNGLSKAGILTPAEEEFRARSNAWFHANLPDPSEVDPSIYDRALHPRAAAWFKTSSDQLIEGVSGYLEVLRSHDVTHQVVYSDAPGEVIYEDEHQVIAKPIVIVTPRSAQPH
jgi:hypothetical protein